MISASGRPRSALRLTDFNLPQTEDSRLSSCFSISKSLIVTNIYVGNLSYDATEDDLRQAFSQFGEVTTVNLIMDRETGRPRGFGFVEMSNNEEAQKAISGVNETEIAGRPVKVNEARPKSDRPRGGGGNRW